MFGTRAFSTASTMAFDSAALRPSGFSHSIGFARLRRSDGHLGVRVVGTGDVDQRRCPCARPVFASRSRPIHSPRCAGMPQPARDCARKPPSAPVRTEHRRSSAPGGKHWNGFCPMKPYPTMPMFNRGLLMLRPSVPPVRVADGDHGGQDVAPRLGIHHHAGWETCSRPSRCAGRREWARRPRLASSSPRRGRCRACR